MNNMIDQIVKVYNDPITKKDFEGLAILLDPIKFDDGDLSIWTVEFLSELGDYYQRTIDINDIISEQENNCNE